MANEVVGIDIVARLDGFREELAKIPDIGGKEARQLAAQLSREIKGAERAAKSAAAATRTQAAAMRTLTAAVSLGPIIEGAKKLAQAFKSGVDRAVELDNIAGGTLKASLDELHGSASSLTDAFLVDLTPALESSARWLADVATGANEAARAFFGLTNEEARNRAATEEGNKAVEAQADRISILQRQLKDYQETTGIRSDGSKSPWFDAREGEIKKTTEELERQRQVLRALKGELRFGENTQAGAAAPAPAARSGGRAVGALSDGAAKEAEANARRMAAAFDNLRTMSEDLVAQRAGDEAQIRLEQERTVAQIRENLATVVDSTSATEDQRLEAIAAAKAAEVALEEETADRIRSIRGETAAAERFNIEQISRARESSEIDYQALASGTLSALGSAVQAFGAIAVAQTAEGSDARKKAMRDAWAAESAMAIITAGLNIPLSISQALASGYPQALVLAPLAAIASGAAFAAVVAKAAAGPTFHSGGMADTGLAPDEFRATLRRGEAVLNPAAVQAFGGADAVQRQNRGDTGGQASTLILQMNNRTVDVQNTESIRRPDSPLAAAIRESRPRRVGSARVW